MTDKLLGVAAIEAAVKAGNVNISSNIQLQTLELSAESKKAQADYNAQQEAAKIMARARSVVVPTADEDVQSKLQLLGHPSVLHNEVVADRRKRLQEIVARMEIKGENVETLDIWVPPLTNGVLEFVEAKLGQSSLVQFSHILFVLIFVSYTGHYA